MKRKAGEGWTDKDKSENVDFLKWPVNLSGWVTNTQMCSVVDLLFVCSSSAQVNAAQTPRELRPPEELRLRQQQLLPSAQQLCTPITEYKAFGMFLQTAAVVKSWISSLLRLSVPSCVHRYFPEQTNELSGIIGGQWWRLPVVLEGSISPTLPQLCVCSSSSLCSALSHFSGSALFMGSFVS